MQYKQISQDSQSLLHLFTKNVNEVPENIAVKYEQQTITYADLDSFSSNLSEELRKKNVKEGDIVSIFLPKGLEQIISIIAIMKLGATYLPLDIEHSSNRLMAILEEAQPKVLITNLDAREQLLPAYLNICYIFNSQEIFAKNKADLKILNNQHLSHKTLAYIIYTSGSSGIPKGVKVSHGNIISLLASTSKLFKFSSRDIWTFFHSYAFDFSVWEMWGALAFGGCLIVVPNMIAKSPENFLNLLIQEKVTVLNQTPSAFYMLMQEIISNKFVAKKLNLRYVIFGGEALNISKVCKFATDLELENISYVNMYGITETTIHTTYYILDTKNKFSNASVIGNELPHLKVYLLDEHLKLIEQPNLVGEIYVAGAGVSQGYLKRPELTAERFISDPYGTPGDAMYRSGDMARYSDSGLLEYIGRLDQQVKIRGYRIDLSEIEIALKSHEAVDDAVVLNKTEQNDGQSLIAFITLSRTKQNTIDIDELKKYMRKCLPIYMLPNHYKLIDSIPLTTNGKVDKKFLLNIMEIEMTSADNNVNETENPLEQFVINVWSKVLGVRNIKRNDDYFDIGGESFKAIKISKELGITVLELFNNPTPSALAKIILSNIQNKKDSSKHEWLQKLNNNTITKSSNFSLICVPYGGASASVYKDFSNYLVDTDVWAVSLPGHDPLNPANLASFEETVSNCVEYIKNNINTPIAIYGHCAGNALAIEITRQLESASISVICLYLGAMLFNKNPENVIAQANSNTIEDDIEFLKSIGGLNGALQTDDLIDLIKVFKNDSIQAANYFLDEKKKQHKNKICAPIHVIVGDKDPVTSEYKTKYQDWMEFSNNVSLSVLGGGGHYFVKYNPELLANLIQNFYFAKISRKESSTV